MAADARESLSCQDRACRNDASFSRAVVSSSKLGIVVLAAEFGAKSII